jgi:acyl carrier protein
MTIEKIEEIVNNFLIDELEVDADKVQPEANLKTDLGIDSLDFVDIVVIVERNFGFKIKADEMANVRTLNDFYEYIENKIQSGE